MKFVLCLLLTVLGFAWSERNYDIYADRVDVLYANPDFFENLKVVFFTYEPLNQRRLNLTVTLKKDLLGNDYTAESHVYKFQGSDYKATPGGYSGNPCVDFKEKGVERKLDKSRMVTNVNDTGCTYKKAYYYILNAYGDESKYPPYAPKGKYMIENKMHHNKTIFLSHTKTYIEIRSKGNSIPIIG